MIFFFFKQQYFFPVVLYFVSLIETRVGKDALVINLPGEMKSTLAALLNHCCVWRGKQAKAFEAGVMEIYDASA